MLAYIVALSVAFSAPPAPPAPPAGCTVHVLTQGSGSVRICEGGVR